MTEQAGEENRVVGWAAGEERDRRGTLLHDLYYDRSGAFKSAAALFRRQQAMGLGFKKYEVYDFVKHQTSQELFQPPISRNTYIPKYPGSQFHVDIFEVARSMFFIAVDTFSKMMWAVPLASKSSADIVVAFEKIIELMGRRPDSIYSDQEKGVLAGLSKMTQVITTMDGHAYFAERGIQTLKKRLALLKFDQAGGKTADLIMKICEAYNEFNRYKKTNLTPNEMMDRKNFDYVKSIYELEGSANKEAEPLKEGDPVRVVTKLQPNQKKARPRFSLDVYEIERVKHTPAGVMYSVWVENESGRRQLNDYLRSDLRPAVATGEADPDYDFQTDPVKPPAVLKTIANDPDSKFKPDNITEKRIPKRQEKLDL